MIREQAGRPLERPDGFFSVLKPAPERLAQKPDDERDDDRIRHAATPCLARLLWQLIDLAGTNIVPAPGTAAAPAIQVEFGRLKQAAARLAIAPERLLDALLFTHPRDIASRHVYAALRAAAARWPDGREPQAFLALYAPEVKGRAIQISGGEPILVAGQDQKPSGENISRGPYLVLVAVGQHCDARGYLPLRGYAQPIFDGRHFVPLDSNFERQLLSVLMRIQRRLAHQHIACMIHNPVFDIETRLGHCRPDFILEMADRDSGSIGSLIVEAMGFADETYLAAKATTHARMATIDPIFTVAPDELNDGDRLIPALIKAAMAHLGWANRHSSTGWSAGKSGEAR